jgi:hypothetical protein
MKERRENGGVVRDTKFKAGKREINLRLWRFPGSIRSSFWMKRKEGVRKFKKVEGWKLEQGRDDEIEALVKNI